MQILTKGQVKYCRIAIERHGGVDCCLGISLHNKLFVSDRFFAEDRRSEAIAYCQSKYLADKGEKSYFIVINIAGLTVWQEDKSARLVGKKSPEDFVADLELGSSIMQMQEMLKTPASGRQIENLETSLEKIMNLKQKIENGCWLNSVEFSAPLKKTCHSGQFDWNEA